MFVACVESSLTVQYLAIVEKLSAGQNIQFSIFAMTLPELSGRRLNLRTVNPTAMQMKRVSIGLSVAKNVSFIVFSPK